MKKRTCVLPFVVSVLVGVVTTTTVAQTFVGSDNFNDNTLTIQGTNPQAAGQWRLSVPNEQPGQTGGAWTETSGRLEWSLGVSTSTTDFNRGQMIWITPSASITPVGAAGLASTPYGSSWSASINATNLLSLSGNQFSQTGVEVYTTGTLLNQSTLANATAITGFYALMLDNHGTLGLQARTQWGVLDPATFGTTNDFSNNNAFSALGTGDTTLTLRLDYDGATRVLSTSFSTDGATFLAGASFDLDGANAPVVSPLGGGLGIRLFATASTDFGTVGNGMVYFDNMSVSAIPEPSTYAVLAGLAALGMVAWRRRNIHRATT